MMDELIELPVEALQRGQFQPRSDFDPVALQELADSIKEQGIIEPIIVRPINASRYEIIAGERRWRAAQLAQLHSVTCIVRHYTDAQAAEVTLIENIQRENLNPIEEAQALSRLLQEFNYTHDELAIAVGKSRTRVSNALRLLNLDPRVQALLIAKKLSEGHGKAIAGLSFIDQFAVASDCVKKSWSVRQLEKQVQHKKNRAAITDADPNIQRLERIAGERFNAEVKLEQDDTQKGGWMKIKYYDHETLAGILDKMAIKLD